MSTVLCVGYGGGPIAEIDEIDHQVLRLLREDGRRTFSEMAAEIGLSVAAVKRRVDRLREIGVITGFTVRVDYAKLGWGIEAFTELRYPGTTPVAKIIRTATDVPEVQEVFTIAGDPDALIHVRVRDLSHLQQVIDRLRRAGDVTGTKTLLVLGSWTRDTGSATDTGPAGESGRRPPR
ncbi:Lrp/AsnC family transcriptional regulator [Microbispora triticiradicis]|uniref:Lrp/AsnC family transcriptional regulator n=1 Tax=Microbispora triticiradicis TaxID=2200763 RepID=UPI002698982D|nr:Lrp/AsnC family transcriptional regulator [Microbispora triticiradicis]